MGREEREGKGAACACALWHGALQHASLPAAGGVVEDREEHE